MINRSIYILGNWKLHKGPAEAVEFVQNLLPYVKDTSCVIGIAPPFVSIQNAAKAASESKVIIGAQNMSEHLHGAYTGEVSNKMLKESGAQFVLIGHSERRSYFHENDHVIHQKMKRAIEERLIPVLCVGETQEERDKNLTGEVLRTQLSSALKNFTKEELVALCIAYEPVWAIGTGKTATPEIAQETHHLCRTFIDENWGADCAQRIPILYGGSVKGENIQSLISQPDIDGALVGGASLEVESFSKIIKNAKDNNL